MNPVEFFEHIQNQLVGLEEEIAQDVVLTEAEEFHGDNWQAQGFIDQGVTPWPARKKPDPTKSILVQSGDMRGHATKGQLRGKHVDFVMPEEYMAVHNTGSTVASGRGSGIPKRQYMGESAELDKRIQEKATVLMDQKFGK